MALAMRFRQRVLYLLVAVLCCVLLLETLDYSLDLRRTVYLDHGLAPEVGFSDEEPGWRSAVEREDEGSQRDQENNQGLNNVENAGRAVRSILSKANSSSDDPVTDPDFGNSNLSHVSEQNDFIQDQEKNSRPSVEEATESSLAVQEVTKSPAFKSSINQDAVHSAQQTGTVIQKSKPQSLHKENQVYNSSQPQLSASELKQRQETLKVQLLEAYHMTKAEDRDKRITTLKEQWKLTHQNHNSITTLHSFHYSKDPQLPPLPAPAPTETAAALLQELQGCSQTLGISQNDEALQAVSENASLFLSAVRSVVPHSFEPDLANFCWSWNYSFPTLDHIRHNFAYHTLWLPNEWPSNHRRRRVTNSLIERFSAEMTDLMKHPRRSRGALLCLPNFYIAGFPKSATTSLAMILNNHTQVYEPLYGKEQHWLTRYNFLNMVSPKHRLFQDHATLCALKYPLFFMPTPGNFTPDSVTYDGSQSTLWGSAFSHTQTHTDYCAMPVVLKHMAPQAKFVVMMRDPVTRTYSDFLWSCEAENFTSWPLAMKRDASSVFSFQFKMAIARFESCVRNASPYECYLNSKQIEKCGSITIARIAIGMYYIHIRKWLQVFPREQFLFLRMEDFSAGPDAVIQQVTEFLGLSEFTPEQKEELFAHKENVNVHAQQQDGNFEMRSDTRRHVTDFFRPYNEKLAELLGDPRFLWND